MPTYAKCHCKVCRSPIEFDIGHAGKNTNCPHCGKTTILLLPGGQNKKKHNMSEKENDVTTKDYIVAITVIAGIACFGIWVLYQSGKWAWGFVAGSDKEQPAKSIPTNPIHNKIKSDPSKPDQKDNIVAKAPIKNVKLPLIPAVALNNILAKMPFHALDISEDLPVLLLTHAAASHYNCNDNVNSRIAFEAALTHSPGKSTPNTRALFYIEIAKRMGHYKNHTYFNISINKALESILAKMPNHTYKNEPPMDKIIYLASMLKPSLNENYLNKLNALISTPHEKPNRFREAKPIPDPHRLAVSHSALATLYKINGQNSDFTKSMVKSISIIDGIDLTRKKQLNGGATSDDKAWAYAQAAKYMAFVGQRELSISLIEKSKIAHSIGYFFAHRDDAFLLGRRKEIITITYVLLGMESKALTFGNIRGSDHHQLSGVAEAYLLTGHPDKAAEIYYRFMNTGHHEVYKEHYFSTHFSVGKQVAARGNSAYIRFPPLVESKECITPIAKRLAARGLARQSDELIQLLDDDETEEAHLTALPYKIINTQADSYLKIFEEVKSLTNDSARKECLCALAFAISTSGIRGTDQYGAPLCITKKKYTNEESRLIAKISRLLD
jgi:hypothetical protein